MVGSGLQSPGEPACTVQTQEISLPSPTTAQLSEPNPSSSNSPTQALLALRPKLGPRLNRLLQVRSTKSPLVTLIFLSRIVIK